MPVAQKETDTFFITSDKLWQHYLGETSPNKPGTADGEQGS